MENKKRALVYWGQYVLTQNKSITSKDVNAYTFSNQGTTNVMVAGETLFPNTSISFGSNSDDSLDMSLYEVSFPMAGNNKLLVRTRKVKFVDYD